MEETPAIRDGDLELRVAASYGKFHLTSHWHKKRRRMAKT
jgi:hypothetical protein